MKKIIKYKFWINKQKNFNLKITILFKKKIMKFKIIKQIWKLILENIMKKFIILINP